jgi:hypothetical protein
VGLFDRIRPKIVVITGEIKEISPPSLLYALAVYFNNFSNRGSLFVRASARTVIVIAGGLCLFYYSPATAFMLGKAPGNCAARRYASGLDAAVPERHHASNGVLSKPTGAWQERFAGIVMIDETRRTFFRSFFREIAQNAAVASKTVAFKTGALEAKHGQERTDFLESYESSYALTPCYTGRHFAGPVGGISCEGREKIDIVKDLFQKKGGLT